jgi:LemA protein
MTGWLIIGGLALLFVIFLFWFIGMYNALVRRRVDCDNGWSQIDVQLKRRYDLIPNLVETVKGYAGHEKGTLEAVISARARAVGVTSDAAHAAEKAAAENMLTQALGRLIAVAEAYPDLKANSNFAQLQEELTSTENKIGFARQHFNDVVARYEESRQSFPTNLVAAAFNFDRREYFKLDDEAAREAPKVKFT